MDILLGIFLVVLGIAIASIGVQLFFVMLPLMGLVGGFFLGAQIVHSWFGDGFLSTLTGWAVGIVVGIAFSLIAWYWWYAGVLISSGVVGAALLVNIGEWVGMSSGFALSMMAMLGVFVFVGVTLLLNLPIYMVIVNTAIGGSLIAVTGVLLVFNQVSRADLSYGAAEEAINDSWLWLIAWAALAAFGIGRQLQLRQQVRLPQSRMAHAS